MSYSHAPELVTVCWSPPELPGASAGSNSAGSTSRRMHRQQDWKPVLGHVVEIRHGNIIVRTGRVDGVTHDDGIIWIAADGAEPRAMFERAQGFSVWIGYMWDYRG